MASMKYCPYAVPTVRQRIAMKNVFTVWLVSTEVIMPWILAKSNPQQPVVKVAQAPALAPLTC